MAHATCKIVCILALLQEFHIRHSQPAILFCDNTSTIHIASILVFHERTKHIEIDYHLVREKIQIGVLKLLHVSSNAQLADIPTKSLSPRIFRGLVHKMGLTNIYSHLEGE